MKKLSTNKVVSFAQWVDKKKADEINQQSLAEDLPEEKQAAEIDLDDELVLSGMLIW